MTDHLPYDEYPKSALLLFADTLATRKAKAHDNEVKLDNESLLKRQKAIRMVKDSKTYLVEKDVF